MPMLLLVEDSEDDAFFFERTVKQSQLGYGFHHVMHGGEAVDFISGIQSKDALPKVIFLDLKMPVMNGFDFLTWMKSQSFDVNIPVVVLSGSEQEQDKERAAKLGAADYLVKPLTNEDLERTLKHILEKPSSGPDSARQTSA